MNQKEFYDFLMDRTVEYEAGDPSISDTEFDKLKSEYESKYGELKVVGVTVKGGNFKLPYVMGSLKKIKPENAQKWLDKYPSTQGFFITEKLDGISFYAKYTNGKLVAASTRGDGMEGKDITGKMMIIKPKLSKNVDIEVRGELMLMGDDYISLGFKTKRNGVAGLINSDDIDKDKLSFVVPYAYENFDSSTDPYQDLINLREIGFNIPHYRTLSNTKGFHIVNYLTELYKNFTEIRVGEIDIDGLVVQIIDGYEREDVKYPTNKVAFKVNEDAVPVNVEYISWNVGRTGRITPVVNIEPTEIGGSTISRATGFNAEFIMSNKIGPGTVVGLVKSGEVIPYITEVIEQNKFGDLPIFCPKCGGEISWQGVDLICENPYCSSYKQVEYFLRTLGAENITTKTLEKLGLDSIQKCFEIDEFDIAGVDGFGIKRGEQIVNEIRGVLNTRPELLLASFGIKNIGKTVSRNIFQHTGCQDFSDVFSLTINDLILVDGIAEKTAQYFLDNINDYRELYDYLMDIGLKFTGGNTLQGKKFTLTQKGNYGRDFYTKNIIDQGGVVKGISKDVDYLVCADMENKTGKVKKALQYGVDVISYNELEEMLNV